MRTEFRLLMAVALMVLVMVGTNVLFPPVEPEPITPADSVGLVEGPAAAADTGLPGALRPGEQTAPAPEAAPDTTEQAPAAPTEPRREVVVAGPLYRFVFSNYGGALESMELPQFSSLASGNGIAQLVPPGTESLVHRLVVGQDTVDLTELGFAVEPADGFTLSEGDSARTLTFSFADPTGAVGVELDYTFRPDDYLVDVTTRVSGLDRPMLVTTLGSGLAFNDADSAQEASAMAYVGNHLTDGIDAEPLRNVDEPTLVEGPFEWVAVKSRYFVEAVLPGTGAPGEEVYLGGILVAPEPGDSRARIAVTHGASDVTSYQLFMGPQDYGRLQALGADLEEVNPYGWRFFRPIIRPFVGAIVWTLTFLHENLNLGYGWVLILFGILLRVILWPLYMKAMRSQLKNMAVQPLVKEIQTKYKDNPERLQQEMLKLYKEHGFNPFGGCLPMLLPWPVLIALFFVFQNTIELRGVSFLWIPDLSAKDPYYLLPVFLAVSMFLLQWISLRSMPESNPQMRLMMWFMPLFFGFIFLNFPAGLNLYYAAMNLATIPQQVIVAQERKRVKPVATKGSTGGGSSGGGKKKGAKSQG
ncbi:MAG TPA: membrane protein insertase YidC [Longimicrobiales bacterium]|nr:membrane protein insertase YidC [Longimicrobiales bacterium]